MLLVLVQQFEPALLELRVGKRDRQRGRGSDTDKARPEAFVSINPESRSVASVGDAQERFGRGVGSFCP